MGVRFGGLEILVALIIWLLAIIIPIFILYWVIRKAVAAGMRDYDNKRAQNGLPPR